VSVDTALPVAVLAPAEDRGLVEASIAAVRAIAPRSGASGRKVAVVFPRYSARRELVEGVAPLNSSWQGDLLVAVGRDRLLTTVAASAPVTPSCESGGVEIAHNADGEVIATMARSSPGAEHEVVVFACVEAGSVAGTALLASVVASVQSTIISGAGTGGQPTRRFEDGSGRPPSLGREECRTRRPTAGGSGSLPSCSSWLRSGCEGKHRAEWLLQ
jgi:hypothetical protein